MSIRDQILAEQSETLQEKTSVAFKLRNLVTKLDQGLAGKLKDVQNVFDPEGANRRDQEGPDMEQPPSKKPPKRPGEDRRSTNEDIAKLAEMLGKGVETHIGTNIPKKYSPKKGGTEADRKRLGRKAKKGEKIVNLSPDLRARISTDEAVEDMTPAQERDRDHRDNATRKTVEKVKLPSTNAERERYAQNWKSKNRGNTDTRKLRDLTLKDSTEFADSVMENLGKLREDSPPNRTTLKFQPIRRWATGVSPELRGEPQQHGGPGPESIGSDEDQTGHRDRIRGEYPTKHGPWLKPLKPPPSRRISLGPKESKK